MILTLGDVIGLEWNRGAVVRYRSNSNCRGQVRFMVADNSYGTLNKAGPITFVEQTGCGEYYVEAKVNP